MGSFNEKKLRVTITLNSAEKAFDEKGNNTVTIEGLRVSANIQTGNGTGITPSSRITIYGLSKEIMNRVAKIQWSTEPAKFNFIRLEALHNNEYIIVYEGTINFAYPNFGSAPDVFLTIDSGIAIQHQITMGAVSSYKGEIAVSTLISNLCKEMGYSFENNGVTANVDSPYLPDPPLEKIRELCRITNTDLAIENTNIAIFPKGGSRNITVPIISPSSGLIGYPIPTIRGINFQCLFDPQIKFGGIVEIKDSVIDIANRKWRVMGLSTSLESMIAGGKWLMEIQAIGA